MGKYIRKRLIQSIPVVFGITILTYFIMKLAPGGPPGQYDQSAYFCGVYLKGQGSDGLK